MLNKISLMILGGLVLFLCVERNEAFWQNVVEEFKSSYVRCINYITDHDEYHITSYQLTNDIPLHLFKTSQSNILTMREKAKLNRYASECKHYILDFKTDASLIKFSLSSNEYLRKREAWYAIHVRQVNDSKLKLIKNIFNMQPYANILHVILLLAAPSLGEYEVYQKPLCMDNYVVEPSSIQHDNSNDSRNIENLYDLDNMKDLSCKHFKATAFLYEPATTITKLDNGKIEYGGYEVRMFDEIAKKSNFDYTISDPKTCCKWGKPDGNGNYTGLLGDMFNKWGDVGWANQWDFDEVSTPEEDVRGGADLTYAYLYDKNCFMLLKTPSLPQFLVPLRPFSLEVWIAILATFTLSLVFGLLYGAFYPLSNISGVQMTLSVLEMLLGNSITQFWKFKSASIRLFCLTCIIVSFILTASYRGLSTAASAIPKLPPQIDTLQQLAESPLNVEGDPDQPLEGDTNPYIQQINTKYEFFDWANEELSFAKVETREIAMLRSELAIDYIIRTRYTDDRGSAFMHKMRECRGKIYPIAFVLQRFSIFTNRFTELIRMMQEGGLIDKWIDIEMDKVPALANEDDETENLQYNLSMIQGPFMVLAFLVGCSSVVFAAELKHRNSNQYKQSKHGQEVFTRSATGLELREVAHTEAA